MHLGAAELLVVGVLAGRHLHERRAGEIDLRLLLRPSRRSRSCPGCTRRPRSSCRTRGRSSGSAARERRVRSRNPRPPGTKIFDWFGRSAPAISIIEIDGSRFCSAMSLQPPGLPRGHLADRAALHRRLARGDHALDARHLADAADERRRPACGPARPCRRAGTARGSTSRDRAAARCARAAAACRPPCGGSMYFSPPPTVASCERGAQLVDRGACSPRGSRGTPATADRPASRSPDTAARRAVRASPPRTVHEPRLAVAFARMANVIEEAKSGRASCRTCKKTIAKGELRLGVEVANPVQRHAEHAVAPPAVRRRQAARRAQGGARPRTPATVAEPRRARRRRWPTRSRRATRKPGGFPYVDQRADRPREVHAVRGADREGRVPRRGRARDRYRRDGHARRRLPAPQVRRREPRERRRLDGRADRGRARELAARARAISKP